MNKIKKQSKKIIATAVSAFSIVSAALMICFSSKTGNVSKLKSYEKTEENFSVFSVLTIEKDSGEICADGISSGKSCGGFSLHDDNSITVNVDGNELPLEDAEKLIGCTAVTNSDGSISVTSPFQTSRIIVSSEKEFCNYGAVSSEEFISGHWLLTYSSPAEAYSAYLKLSEDDSINYAEPDSVMVSSDADETVRIDNPGTEITGTKSFCNSLEKNADSLPEVKVAVVDTGIYSEHSVFKNRILEGGQNFVSASDDSAEITMNNSTEDDEGHGSHCAGIICSSTCENVKILPVKVLNSSGYGSKYGIYCGLKYAIDCDVDVISLSIGGYGKSYLYDEVMAEAEEKGIVVCVAAGNESRGNSDFYSSLSDIESCVVISSVDDNLEVSDFSNYQNIDFAAPGRNIESVSTEGTDATTVMSGTSMATPFAAACFADLYSWDSSLSMDEAYEILKNNALDICETGYDDQTGWGVVNLKGIIEDDEPDTAETTTVPDESETVPSEEDETDISDASGEIKPESIDSSLLVGLNEPFINESGEAYFIPEKTGYYSIILIPDRSQIEEAVNKGGFMSYPLVQTVIYDTRYGSTNIVRIENEVPQSAQYSSYLEKGVVYRLKLSSRKSELLITDKTTLAECTVKKTLSYKYTGEEITPDIEMTYNSETLKEGADYRITAWNNTDPGIMYVLAEGCGNYAGFLTMAMTIDGAGITAGKYRGDTVINITPDESFDIADFLNYRVTFTEDTLVRFDKGSSTAQLTATLTGEYESDIFVIASGKTAFVKSGTYLVTFMRSSMNSMISYRTAVRNACFETSPVNRMITDAEIIIKTGISKKPEFTVSYEGEILEKGNDYNVSFPDTEDPGIYEATVRGKNDYSGLCTVQYYILPDKEYTVGEVKDGTSNISISENSCFEWIPENNRYHIVYPSYFTSDMIITDEDFNQILYTKADSKTDTEVKVESGKKYFIWFLSRYSFDTELTLTTHNSLSDCYAEYIPLRSVDDMIVSSDFVIRDEDNEDYILQEGTDYKVVNEGTEGVTGLREFVFSGMGDYYGDLIVPVIVYSEHITDFESFEEAEGDRGYKFSKPLVPGESLNLKLTADENTEYSTEFLFDVSMKSKECENYLILLTYNENGDINNYSTTIDGFSLDAGETAYVSWILPYYYNTNESEDVPETTIYITKERCYYASVCKAGDVNCDGKVNILDYLRLQRYLVTGEELSEQGRINASLKSDSSQSDDNNMQVTLTAADLVLLKKLLLGCD